MLISFYIPKAGHILRDSRMLCVWILLFVMGCEPFADHSNFIEVKNHSGNTINCFAVFIYPDSLLPLSKPRFIEVKHQSRGFIDDYSFNDSRFERNKITIFILSKDTVEKYNWDDIRANYRILKRYEVTLGDITNMGGFVLYP